MLMLLKNAESIAQNILLFIVYCRQNWTFVIMYNGFQPEVQGILFHFI